LLIQNPFSSRTNNLNPFNIGMYQGLMRLDPPGQIFFEDRRIPDQTVDALGEFDTLKEQSLYKKDGLNIFGSINDIELLNQGSLVSSERLPSKLRSLNDLLGELSPTTTTVDVSGNEVVKNTDIKPLMKSVSIRFNVEGLRPNTLFNAFFDGKNVNNNCEIETEAVVTAQDAVAASSTVATNTALANAQADTINTQLQSDATGSLSGTFYHDSGQNALEVGKKIFRITNSPTNDKNTEISFAEAVFFSDGIVRQIYKEVLRPPDPPPEDNGYDDDIITPDDNGGGGPNGPPPKVEVNDMRYLDLTYKVVGGPSRIVGPFGEPWTQQFNGIMGKNKRFNDLTDQEILDLDEALFAICSGFVGNALGEGPGGPEPIGEKAVRTRAGKIISRDTRFKTLLSTVVWSILDAHPLARGNKRRGAIATLVNACRSAIQSNKTI
jgi:hypothetical protein